MWLIKTVKDIERLRRRRLLPEAFLALLDANFAQLGDIVLEEGKTLADCDLREYGFMVVLDGGDDVSDLSELGLNPNEGGFSRFPRVLNASTYRGCLCIGSSSSSTTNTASRSTR